ncbi:MAG: flavodoxin-dependent (E)-4-hydroxy-3-methylbut-2-enyl-diphosphate synthase [Dehalococcoidia bacterium]|nr:flavodoxin-dependent (E)-4-hydroxy-3-methylbut-2-enyl-diphosphate synthase [Chloroflexota bacterium]MYB47913.1 flavodoxin-dependent (E)-4-hydroxy-3-methylbut-2-enyl-diphosphate synthase [Dehalococcoidia bacterium]
MTTRRVSKQIHVGNVAVGGDARVTVQSMTKTDTRDVAATVEQIRGLEEAGCDIIRAAVPDMEAAQALAEIKRQISIPLIADIHFHYQLALEALKSGVDCLRLNPGNIRDRGRVEEIVREAKARQVPIRIGVNFGSLPPVGKIGGRGVSRHLDGVNMLPKPSEAQPGDFTVVDHMVETGLWEIGILEDLDFDLIKISMKAFDIDTTVEAYRRMAEIVPYPLHLGITEAGTARSGSIRSAIGLGALLYDGIGDTIRVSLSDDPTEEVYTGLDILRSLELRKEGATLVACPSCGRADVDIRQLSNTVDDLLRQHKTPIKVAVMGCEVNGPGEAKDADVGIAAGVGRAVIFRKGQKARVVAEDDMLDALMEEVGKAEAEIR